LSKITIFSHPYVFCAPLKGFPWELATGAEDQKTSDVATEPNKYGQSDGQTDTG